MEKAKTTSSQSREQSQTLKLFDTLEERLSSSFRDPSGFVFRRGGVLFRQVNQVCASDYGRLMTSGLYDDLAARGLLVSHVEESIPAPEPSIAFKIIRPREITFVSYPYEWCFSQLRDAALLTLEIQETAVQKGMCLKDASGFNIQFERSKPIHIDTLSFTAAETGAAWVGYRQFCENFLVPLALMALRDARLGRLLAHYLDGIPLDLAYRLLPRRAFCRFHRWLHLWLHSVCQRSAGHFWRNVAAASASQYRRLALIDSLRSAILSIPAPKSGSHWSQYETECQSYSPQERTCKEAIVCEMISAVRPNIVWDIGCNTGVFSRIAADQRAYVVASDYDHDCVESLYRRIRGHEISILPLLVDFTNPTPPVGWVGRERMSWQERGPADLILALAVMHHWTLGNNVPLPMLVQALKDCGRHLVVEFVPKTDPMSRLLLANRKDIFPDYDRPHFEVALSRHFVIRRVAEISESGRVLYLCENPSISR